MSNKAGMPLIEKRYSSEYMLDYDNKNGGIMLIFFVDKK